MSRRRHSDSSLFCKARDQNIEESEKKEERFLGEEKYEFVERYLENVHNVHSAMTETSDSGVQTHGAQSELGMEDISGDTHTALFKDLSKEVISEMGNRINADHHTTRRILQSFEIPDHFLRKFGDIFHLFPDTPVKLLRDVCETLQLYDLVELLEKPIPRITKSLRPVLTLDEVRKLGKIDGRPVSHHSRAAVLIFADSEDDSNVKSCESFFKSLNNKSEVTIVQCSDLLKLARKRSDIELFRLNKATAERWDRSIKNVRRGEQWQQVEQQIEMMKLTSQLQMQRQTVEQLEKELEEVEAKEKREEENIKTTASKVIDRWIQRQDEFSFFAVFTFSSVWQSDDVSSKLCLGIPNKTKLVVGDWWTAEKLSETLLVTFPRDTLGFHLGLGQSLTLLLDILNKRWQTLDLVSMMDELKRSAFRQMGGRYPYRGGRLIIITGDTLSSLPRFKREQDKPT